MQQLEYFKRAIKKDRLVHLYLFNGIKATSLAKDVCIEIFLEYGSTDNDIKQIRNEIHPNIVIIRSQGETIKKEQIIALQSEFSKTSLVEGPRAYIIEETEKMTSAASNSLLKFLEEPQNENIFGFLTTNYKELVLPTILSRSQIINLSNTKNFDPSLLNDKNQWFKELIPEISSTTAEYNELVNDINIPIILTFYEEFLIEISKKKGNLVTFINEKGSVLYVTRKHVYYFLSLLFIFFSELLKYKQGIACKYECFKEIMEQFYIDEKSILSIVKRLQKDIYKQQSYLNNELAIMDIIIYLESKV